MTWDTLNIHKSHLSRNFVRLYAFIHLNFLNILAFQHCFSQFRSHVLWFLLNSWKKLPRGWVLARFLCPRGRDFALFWVREWGNRSFNKIPRVLPGGMVRLGTEWYITATWETSVPSLNSGSIQLTLKGEKMMNWSEENNDHSLLELRALGV